MCIHASTDTLKLSFMFIWHEFVFLSLQQLYRKRPGMTMLCAKLPQNVSKNRYRDISPCTWLSARLFTHEPTSLMLSPATPVFASPHLKYVLSMLVNCLSVIPPFFLSSLPLCRWCHAGYSEKHRWLHQCKLHQCEFVAVLSCCRYLSRGGWSVRLTIKTHVGTLWSP